MGQEETRGKANQVKGRVKEAAGILTGNRELEQEGSRERASGEVQETVGKVRRRAAGFLNEVAEKIKK